MIEKGRKVLVGLFATLGLVVFSAIVVQLVTGFFIDHNVCHNQISKSFPSPDRTLNLQLTYQECTDTGATSELLLSEVSDQSTAEILLTINSETPLEKSFPVPIKPMWSSERALDIYIPREYIPFHSETKSYGVSVQFHAFEW